MTSPSHIRLGIIGVGNMGSSHANSILSGKVRRVELAAVCDIDPAKLAKFDKIKGFSDSAKLIRSGQVDAVLIATPHYAHTTIGSDALANGLHVLVEKPISVHKADCERLIAAYAKRPKKGQVFAAMFNQRTDPRYIKLRALIQSGELGELRRINWIITDWYRTQAYYNSGGWRATWRGEGGGVLINQCPHQLDLMQWLFGMPKKVRGHCGIGKHHSIEVEDAVTAYLEYANGATGVFITTTGEAPGTNRLEVVGDRGTVVAEGGDLAFTRTTEPVSQHLKTCPGSFVRPEVWHCRIPVNGHGDQHIGIMNNFADAIIDGQPLIAQASEGIRSVELGNSMLLSSLLDCTLTLPLDSRMVDREFKKLIAKSRYTEKKPAKAKNGGDEFAKSFGH